MCSLPGFSRLRMHSKPIFQQQQLVQGQGTNNNGSSHIPVAFVEFRDVHSAASAMQALQGKYLLSSDRGAIRIEYAKSKMASELATQQLIQYQQQPVSTYLLYK